MSDPKQTLSDPTKTFPIASDDVWYCVQTTSTQKNGTTYTPPSPSLSGSCRTDVLDGKAHVDLTFNVTEAGDGTYSVDYTITYRSLEIPESDVWNGIQDLINQCSSS